jgi:hypothetical protein
MTVFAETATLTPTFRHGAPAPGGGCGAPAGVTGVWFPAASLSIAAVALGAAVQVNFGQRHPLALAWLTVSIAACAAGVLRMRRGASLTHRSRRRLLAPEVLLLCGGVAAQVVMLLSRSPGVAELEGNLNLLPFRGGMLAAALLLGLASFGPRRLRTASLILLLAVHFALGLWLLRSTRPPGVDVCVFQRDACEALLAGGNPYALTFPDVSPAGGGQAFYGPGLSSGGRLHFGYPYPPLSLLMALPGHLLGDFRYAQLAAMTLAAAFIAGCRPGPRATLAAGVLLLTPRGFFVLQAGWTEPFVVLMLAATVFLACRRETVEGEPPSQKRWPLAPWPLAVAFGLLLSMKQYVALAMPLAWLLLPPLSGRDVLRFALIAAAAALLVTLPMALWDAKAFAHSALLLQFRQPLREDALSYLPAIASARDGAAAALLPFALAAGAVAVCLWRCPRTPCGFAAAFALTFLVFFAFNKQAFCNYYHLVIAALCCAVAAAAPRCEPFGWPAHFKRI